LFQNVIGGAGFEALDGRLLTNGAGHENERQQRIFRPHQSQGFHPIEVWQVIVSQDKTPIPRLQRLHKIGPVFHMVDFRGDIFLPQQIAHKQDIR
jgi:hypothetical protein